MFPDGSRVFIEDSSHFSVPLSSSSQVSFYSVYFLIYYSIQGAYFQDIIASLNITQS